MRAADEKSSNRYSVVIHSKYRLRDPPSL